MKSLIFDVKPELRKDHPIAYYTFEGASYALRYTYYIEKGAFEATNFAMEHFQDAANRE